MTLANIISRAIATRSHCCLLLAVSMLLPACSDKDPVTPAATRAAPRVLFATVGPLHEQMAANPYDYATGGAAADDFIVPADVSWSISQVVLVSTNKPCDLRFFTYEGGVHTEVATYVNVTAGATSAYYSANVSTHTIPLPAPLTLGPGRYWLGAKGNCAPLEFLPFTWLQANGPYLLDARELNANWSFGPASYPMGVMFALYGASVTKEIPSFTFDLTTLPAKTNGDENFSVASYASTNSTGAITFRTGTGSVGCSVTPAGDVSIQGSATDTNYCVLEAWLAEDATYAAAGPLAERFNIAKGAGWVTISNIPGSATVGGSFTALYTQAGDGTPSVQSTTTSVCTVSGDAVSFIANGTCTLVASVTEGTDFLAATGSEQSFAIGALTPTFAFNLSGLPAKTYGDPSFSVAGYASSNSTGAITFATGSGSVGCSVTSAGMVTITGAATGASYCVLQASLAADATYLAAGPISQSFNIARATGSVTISNIPANATVNGSFTPAYTKSGNGAASVVSTTTAVCTVTGGVVRFIAEGTCTLVASVAQSANYLAATGSPQSFTVGPAPVFGSTCTYTINARNGQRAVTVSWHDAFPGVTLIRVLDGRTFAKVLSPTATGSWSVKAKSGAPTYELRGGTTRNDITTLLASGPCSEQL